MKILLQTLSLFVLMALGLVVGLAVRPVVDQLLKVAEEHDQHADGEQVPHDDEHEDEHLSLSFEAVKNLNLLVRPVELSDYTIVRRTPGEIVESPGLSSQKIAAPVSGRVDRLFAAPGMSVAKGDRLVEMEIIDDELMEAQLKLLELLTRQRIVSAELDRLAPLAESGGIAGRKRLELEYEQQENNASLSRTRQELAMRGLTPDQVARIEEEEQAITKMTVRIPAIAKDAGAITAEEASLAERANVNDSLSLENLWVEVGQNVRRGEAIANLAVHGLLLVCGHAFENELELVTQIASDATDVSIEFGTAENIQPQPGFRVQHVAGHAEEQTQVFYFYVPLENEVLRKTANSLGQTYCTWKYKVGQRVHLLLPEAELKDQIVLPRAAVVQQGPEYFVFREIEIDFTDHVHEGIYMEMERVPVEVVARDKQSIVIAPGGQISVGDRVAINAAYQMQLALRAQQEGGGGHQHDHVH